jgi:hypothetical protein
MHAHEVHTYEIYTMRYTPMRHAFQIPILQTVVDVSYRKLRNREIEKSRNALIGQNLYSGYCNTSSFPSQLPF